MELRCSQINQADEQVVPSTSWCPFTYLPGTGWLNSLMEEERWTNHKHHNYNGESHCARPSLCVWFMSVRCQKTSRQVWNSERAQRQGDVFADRPLVRPETPTPALWCLCVFVNEEILVPWWDIALSWADCGFWVPSALSYSGPTHLQKAPGPLLGPFLQCNSL